MFQGVKMCLKMSKLSFGAELFNMYIIATYSSKSTSHKNHCWKPLRSILLRSWKNTFLPRVFKDLSVSCVVTSLEGAVSPSHRFMRLTSEERSWPRAE